VLMCTCPCCIMTKPKYANGSSCFFFGMRVTTVDSCFVLDGFRSSCRRKRPFLTGGVLDWRSFITRSPAKARGGRPYETGSRNMVATQKINFLTPVSYSLLQTLFR